MKDYYSILGIPSSAHPVDVKRAYRKLASVYHPDKNPDPRATALFIEINEAYEILSDPSKRSLYDLQRNAAWSNVIVEEEPTPRHRDPYYRRRAPRTPRQALIDYYQLMKQYHQRVLWSARIGIVIGVLFALDYYLPFQLREETVAYVSIMNGGKHSAQKYRIETNEGSHLSVDAEFINHFRHEPSITVAYSTIFSNAIWITPTHYPFRVNVHLLYTTLVFFPLALLSTSAMAFIFKSNTELSFNFCVVAGVLILITIALL